jgi:cell division protein FtsB
MAVVSLVLGLGLVGSLFAFVYPTRTYLDQRADTHAAEQRLALLRAENERLADEAERLQSDEAVERIAREQYGLLRPGEHAFVIVPVPTTTLAASPPDGASASTTAPPSTAVPKDGKQAGKKAAG